MKFETFSQSKEAEKLAFENKAGDFLTKLPRKDGYLDIPKLQKIGEGGTNLVYEDPENQEFVVKVIKGVLETVRKEGTSELSKDLRKRAEDYITISNTECQKLYEYFGDEHCLREYFVLGKINVDGKTEAETVLSVQEKSEVFKDPTKVNFDAYYVEERDDLKDKKTELSSVNKALLADGQHDEESFLKLYERLKPIFKLIETEESFSEAIKDFVDRFKKYFEATGRFIDIIGEENLLLYQKEGRWTFQLGSVIKAETKQNVGEALEMLENNPEALNDDEEKINRLKNGINLIRILNAIGLKTGLGKVVDINLTTSQLENLEKVKF